MDSFSLQGFNDAVLHWKELPSVVESDEIFRKTLFRTISSARSAALLRLTTIYRDSGVMHNDPNEIMRVFNAEITPLFQQISASIIQVVTNSIQTLLSNMETRIDGFIQYFIENPFHAGVFGYLTFPAIFFYFMTSDFLDIGENFIIEVVKRHDGPLSMYLCSSFFDSIPDFQTRIWSFFHDNLSNDKSVVFTFLESLTNALSVLSPQHHHLITELITNHRHFAICFFFSYYFPANSAAFFAKYQNCTEDNAVKELNKAFGYVVNNQDSALAELFLSHFSSEKSVSPLLNYADTELKTVHSIISGLELTILFQAFKSCEMIKKASKIASLVIPNDVRTSLMPGSIQFPAKKNISSDKTKYEPLIFTTEAIPETESNSDFSRTWAALQNLAKEKGKSPLQLIQSAQSTKLEEALPPTETIKSPEFTDYVIQKMKMKVANGKLSFENFILWKATEAIIAENAVKFKDGDMHNIILIANENIATDKCLESKETKIETISGNNPLENLFPANFQRRYSIINTTTVMTKQTKPQTEFKTTVEKFMQTGNSDIFSFAMTLELVNSWKEDSEENASFAQAFASFVNFQRMEILSSPHFNYFKNNKYLIKVAKHIRKTSNLPVGSRILKMNDSLFDLYYISNELQKNRVDGAKLPDIAVDAIIISGREDFHSEMIWFERIASTMSKSVNAYKPHTREIWASFLSRVVSKLNNYDKQMFTEMAESISVFI